MNVVVVEPQIQIVATPGQTVVVEREPVVQIVTTPAPTVYVPQVQTQLVTTPGATIVVEREPAVQVVETAGATIVVQEPPAVQVVETPGPIIVVENNVIQIVEVSPGVPNPTLIFKTVDEANATDVYTNDDELRFEVEEGSRYTMRMTLIVASTGAGQVFRHNFDVPTDVVLLYNRLEIKNTNLLVPLVDDAFDDDWNVDGTDEATGGIYLVYAVIDASLAGGQVVFQFRNEDGDTSGAVTVKAGSFIELFKVT